MHVVGVDCSAGLHTLTGDWIKVRARYIAEELCDICVLYTSVTPSKSSKMWQKCGNDSLK
jgi:hypothetical protein